MVEIKFKLNKKHLETSFGKQFVKVLLSK